MFEQHNSSCCKHRYITYKSNELFCLPTKNINIFVLAKKVGKLSKIISSN